MRGVMRHLTRVRLQLLLEVSLQVLVKAAHVTQCVPGCTLQFRNILSFCCNAAIILTTIHAQDFRDEVGDKVMGRRTLPIVWPEASRIAIFVFLCSWSLALSIICELSSFFSALFCALAAATGAQFYFYRDVESDQRTYLYYNVCTLFLTLATASSDYHLPNLADVACSSSGGPYAGAHGTSPIFMTLAAIRS